VECTDSEIYFLKSEIQFLEALQGSTELPVKYLKHKSKAHLVYATI